MPDDHLLRALDPLGLVVAADGGRLGLCEGRCGVGAGNSAFEALHVPIKGTVLVDGIDHLG